LTHREAWDKRTGLGLLCLYKWYTESNGNSIEFSLSNADKEAVGLIPALDLASLTMRLLEGCSTLYTSLSIRVSRIGAKLVCLSITSKQAKVAPESCHGI